MIYIYIYVYIPISTIYIRIYVYIAEEPDYSRAEEVALFNELMSQLAESQGEDEGEDEGEGVAQDDDDEGGIEDYILQRYLQHVARTQGLGRAKIQSWFRKAFHAVKKVASSPITHAIGKAALGAIGKK